jgi:hypothetical protein
MPSPPRQHLDGTNWKNRDSTIVTVQWSETKLGVIAPNLNETKKYHGIIFVRTRSLHDIIIGGWIIDARHCVPSPGCEPDKKNK